MTNESQPPSYRDPTPAELIADSKAKYTLSLARLRREQPELALLSLTGSVEDVLRAHFLLRRDPKAQGTLLELAAALRDAPEHALAPDEIEGLRRMQSLRAQITQGDAVTLTRESVAIYQNLIGILLPRYGVAVPAPDQTPPVRRENPFPTERRTPAPWQRYQHGLTPVLMIVLIFIIGATATVALQRARSTESGATTSAPTTPFTAEITTRAPQATAVTIAPTPPLIDQLAPGQTASVRLDMTGGLSLRTEPSTSAPAQSLLTPGTEVEVLAGPVEADGYVWWQVRAANQEGWCAGEFLEVR